MKPALIVLIILSLCLFCCRVNNTDSVWSSTFSASVTLSNFSYNGSHTVYFALIPINEWDGGTNLNIEGSFLPFGTSTDQSGTYSVTIPIEFSSSDEYQFDGSSIQAAILIASDENDSGDLAPGTDLIIPGYKLEIENGETYSIDGLTFDVGDTFTAGLYDTSLQIDIDNLVPPESIDAAHPVYIRVDNAGNTDFTLAPNFRQITITDPRLLNTVYLHSIPGGGDTYSILVIHDADGSGIDIGDPASEEDRTNVSAARSTDGSHRLDSIQLTLDPNITLIN